MLDLIMGIKLERDPNGRMILSKEKGNNGRVNRKKVLTMGLAVAIVAIAIGGIQAAVAVGDKVQHNYGEDGYYEDNNENPWEDDDFPGEDTQNRTGVDELL